MRFSNAIIIGASSGIGREIALQLAHMGCNVGLVARRLDALTELSEEIQMIPNSPSVVICAHDVCNYGQAGRLFQDISQKLGGLDVVFYVAGLMEEVEPDEYDIGRDALMIAVNLTGAMAWMNEAARRFARLNAGTIVGVSSIAGDRGRRGNPAYCSSKAGLNTYLESLRNRVARYGVRVVNTKPGFVDTEMTRGKSGLLWLISSDRAAELIIRAAQRGARTAYIPGRWRIIGTIVKMIPSFIFKRLNI